MTHTCSLRPAGALLALPLLAACSVSAYTPRPSPRIQVTTEGNSIALVKSGRKYAVNVLGGELEEAVSGNPEAEAEARSFRNKLVTGFVLSTIGTVGAATGAGLLVGNQVQSNPSTTVEVGSISAVVGGLVLSIVGGVIGSSAQPHLWNAVNMYNDGLPAYPAWPQRPAYPGYPAPGYPAPGYPAPADAPPAYAPPAGAPAPSSYAPAVAPAPAPVPAPVPAPQPH
jgi:hypothetical protein